MINYLTLGSNDVARSQRFYDAIMTPLGYKRLYGDDGMIGYGAGRPIFYLMKPYNGNPATNGNGTMISLVAQGRKAVDAFHATALAVGGKDEGAPGIRASVHENFYAAYVRDHDGNKLSAVCETPA
jgi:catechol 2,3-dioxygenase-like lactoylglutathione lyase family enzyme